MQKVILTLSIITLIINSTLSADPFDINKKLGRGVNFGNGLDAPSEGEWGLTLQESHFEKKINFCIIDFLIYIRLH